MDKNEVSTLLTMIRLIEELSNMRTPIIFKGAMVLKTAISGVPINTERMTRDIDGDWISEAPSMVRLTDIINKALSNVDGTLKAVAYRDYGNGKSAGFNIINSRDKKVFSIDISVKQNPYYRTYTTGINHVEFYGATPEKMFADKMRAVSTRAVYRRAKDLYDLYLLSVLPRYSSIKIMEILQNNKLGNFEDFKTGFANIEYAYNKLERITNKPNFKIVYARVYEFTRPFIEGYCNQNLVWTGEQWTYM